MFICEIFYPIFIHMYTFSNLVHKLIYKLPHYGAALASKVRLPSFIACFQFQRSCICIVLDFGKYYLSESIIFTKCTYIWHGIFTEFRIDVHPPRGRSLSRNASGSNSPVDSRDLLDYAEIVDEDGDYSVPASKRVTTTNVLNVGLILMCCSFVMIAHDYELNRMNVELGDIIGQGQVNLFFSSLTFICIIM